MPDNDKKNLPQNSNIQSEVDTQKDPFTPTLTDVNSPSTSTDTVVPTDQNSLTPPTADNDAGPNNSATSDGQSTTTSKNNAQSQTAIINTTKNSDGNSSKKFILPVLGVLVLALSVGAGVFLVQRQQNIEEQARGRTQRETPRDWRERLNEDHMKGCYGTINCDEVFFQMGHEHEGGEAIIYVDGVEYTRFSFGGNPNGAQQYTWTWNVTPPPAGSEVSMDVWDGRSGRYRTASVETMPSCEIDYSASCSEVTAYDNDWKPLSMQQLTQLSAGETVKFVVTGQSSNGTIDKARFRINSSEWIESSDLKPGEASTFYINYTIPESVTSFIVNGQVHLVENNSWY